MMTNGESRATTGRGPPYVRALTLLLRRLTKKHREKGLSFLELNEDELDVLLGREFDEWNHTTSTDEEIEELLDVAICCILKVEWHLQSREGVGNQ